MQKLHLKVTHLSNSIHLEQLFTGFESLRQIGMLQINYSAYGDSNYRRGNGLSIIKVILNDKLHIIFDTQDSQEVINDVALLENVQYYFKRSFHLNTLNNAPASIKYYPLGFNYLVFSNHSLIWSRVWSAGNPLECGKFWVKQSKIAGRILGVNNSAYNAQQKKLEELPKLYKEPKILLMTRAWPEYRAKTEEKKEHRYKMNQMRAACIRALKKEFNKSFFGGFYVEDYSKTNFPDCLLPDNKIASKKSYLNLVKGFPICVATTGLENSTGWRMGEYIALSKAILSEKLLNQVPGNFSKEENYLEFNSANECVEHAIHLFKEPELMYNMMRKNHQYYHAYLRPDMLILNSLLTVILDQEEL